MVSNFYYWLSFVSRNKNENGIEMKYNTIGMEFGFLSTNQSFGNFSLFFFPFIITKASLLIFIIGCNWAWVNPINPNLT